MFLFNLVKSFFALILCAGMAYASQDELQLKTFNYNFFISKKVGSGKIGYHYTFTFCYDVAGKRTEIFVKCNPKALEFFPEDCQKNLELLLTQRTVRTKKFSAQRLTTACMRRISIFINGLRGLRWI